MNKALGFLLVIAIAFGVVPYASSIGARSPPPGIPEGSWIPMGDAAGFVITNIGNEVKGYFVARHDGTWRRVDATADYAARPAVCPNARRTPLYGL